MPSRSFSPGLARAGPRWWRPPADGGNAAGGAASHRTDASRLRAQERTPNPCASGSIPATDGVSMVGALDTRMRTRGVFAGVARVSDAWERDAAAGFVEELFAAHHGEIYAYLIRMLRDPELAADLTQDAFVKAYRNYDTLEKAENARAWLYQIAHRVALDHIRRSEIVRFLPWTGESHGAAPSTERLVMDAHLSSDMQRALERIPERQRAAPLLAELHDLTGLELAAALGVSHVAARALLTRARESLRQALAAERDAEAAEDVEAEARATTNQSSRGAR